ncbi:MAG: PTS sugar transporter subunit IIA, partial [Salinispira sp.]
MNLVKFLLDENMIRVNQEAANWKEAVKLGISLLVDSGKASWNYYNAILRSAERNGPYFVLMPGVVLPHARPEEGALGTGFSLVTLKEPVNFGSPENDPISILLSFCAADAAS